MAKASQRNALKERRPANSAKRSDSFGGFGLSGFRQDWGFRESGWLSSLRGDTELGSFGFSGIAGVVASGNLLYAI